MRVERFGQKPSLLGFCDRQAVEVEPPDLGFEVGRGGHERPLVHRELRREAEGVAIGPRGKPRKPSSDRNHGTVTLIRANRFGSPAGAEYSTEFP